MWANTKNIYNSVNVIEIEKQFDVLIVTQNTNSDWELNEQFILSDTAFITDGSWVSWVEEECVLMYTGSVRSWGLLRALKVRWN